MKRGHTSLLRRQRRAMRGSEKSAGRLKNDQKEESALERYLKRTRNERALSFGHGGGRCGTIRNFLKNRATAYCLALF